MDTITMSGKESPRPGILKALCDARITNQQAADPLHELIVAAITTTYAGLNDVHLTEKLQEEHALAVSRPTVRRLRCALGQPAKRRRRAPKHRRRRARHAAAGSL